MRSVLCLLLSVLPAAVSVGVVEHKDCQEDSERRVQAPQEPGKHQQGAAQLDGGDCHRGECWKANAEPVRSHWGRCAIDSSSGGIKPSVDGSRESVTARCCSILRMVDGGEWRCALATSYKKLGRFGSFSFYTRST